MSEPYWVPMGGAGVPGPQGVKGDTGATGPTGPLGTVPEQLGTPAKAITNWNSAVENGWYYSQPGATNAPEATYHYMGEVVVHVLNSWTDQVVWAFAQGAYRWRYRRQQSAGTWTAWVPDPIAYRGAYAAGVPYGPGDVVLYAGRYWMSISNTVSVTPA